MSKQKDKNMLEHAENVVELADKSVRPEIKKIHSKYPVTIGIISLVGFSALLYGFERFFETIPILYGNPILLIFIGIAILIGTGTLYKALLRKDFLK